MSFPSKPTRTDGRSGRFYNILNPDGTTARYPSVTTILGAAIAKPALIAWSAKEERTAVSEAAAEFYAETINSPQLPRPMYLLGLEQRLGKTKAHLKALAKAAEIGSQAHAAVEWSLKMQLLGIAAGPKPPMVAGAELAFQSWQTWAQQVELTPVLVEQCVWSRTHEYAGTLDLVATLQPRALLALLQQQGPVAPPLAAWLEGRERVTAVIDLKTSKSIYAEHSLQTAAYIRALQEMGHGPVDGGLIVRLPKVGTDPGFEVAVCPPARDLFPTFLAARQLWAWAYQEEQAYQARRARVA